MRNRLSSAFIEAIRRRDMTFLAKQAEQLARQFDNPLYHRYMEGRIERYQQVADGCLKMQQKKCDVFQLTVLLWKHLLFFEVHEVLEEVWGKAAGKQRKALQGLIQAAGYYLLLEAGNCTGAVKLADKAIANLSDNRQSLPADLHIEELIDSLRRRDGFPSFLG